MAKLDRSSYPGDWKWHVGSENAADYIARREALLNAIPSDRVLQFPVADSYAMYFVKSFNPLVLQSIPYGDAFTIPDARIRGLRESDVRSMLARQALLAH